MMMHAGALVVMTAATAIYQPQAQLLDLFDDVTLVHQNGTRFLTRRAHVDVAANTAEGHDPVSGHGPSGDIAAQGFKILDKGDRVIFTGEANLVLKGSRPRAASRIAARHCRPRSQPRRRRSRLPRPRFRCRPAASRSASPRRAKPARPDRCGAAARRRRAARSSCAPEPPLAAAGQGMKPAADAGRHLRRASRAVAPLWMAAARSRRLRRG